MSFAYKNQLLHAESVAITDLMNAYGSPLYVYSKTAIEANWRRFDDAFKKHSHLICYAVKANSNLAVLGLLAKLGSGFDVVSGGELERVLAAGGQAGRCVFSGVGKSVDEIKQGLMLGICCFNVESAAELERIEKVARKLNKPAPISIRLNPDVDVKTHTYIATGRKENKFGVDSDEAFALYQKAQHSQHLQIQGLGYHIGSQITTVAPFLAALDKALMLLQRLKQHNIEVLHLNLGGGIGIQYENEKTIDIASYVNAVLGKITYLKIIIEPGRSIVGDAGAMITKVEFLKQNNTKSFAIIDAAMNDLIRPAFYNAYHQICPIKQNSAGVKAHWDLVGPICESGDFIGKNRDLTLSEGDYLAVMNAGAYAFCMSSNYNSRPRAAEVMVSNDKHQLVRERETLNDLFLKEYLFK